MAETEAQELGHLLGRSEMLGFPAQPHGNMTGAASGLIQGCDLVTWVSEGLGEAGR